MFNKLAELRAVAFHLNSINNAQISVTSRMNPDEPFERGMIAGRSSINESFTPYIEELSQLVAELTAYFEQPYMVDDLTYEGGEELESA